MLMLKEPCLFDDWPRWTEKKTVCISMYTTLILQNCQKTGIPLTLKRYLNCKYDVSSCLSQSEDINPGVLSVKTEFMKVYERACHED